MKCRICLYCLNIFSIIIVAGCSRVNDYPPKLKSAIQHFYNENENEKVHQIIADNHFFIIQPEAHLVSKLFFAAALCEDAKIDSARKVFNTIPKDKLKPGIDFLYQSIYGLLLFRSDSLAKSYITLSNTLNFKNADPRAEALNRRLLARIAFTAGDYKNGMEWLISSSQLFTEQNLPKSVGVNSKILGRYLLSTGNQQQAFICFRKAENAFLQANDSAELFYIYINMLDFYLEKNKPLEAEKYAHQSMRYSKKQKICK